MATIAGRDNVSRPGTGAERLAYGLYTVANGPLDLPTHASVGGLDFQTPYCKAGSLYEVNCPPATKSASLTGGYQTVNGDPFVVLVGSECGSLSGDDLRDPDQYTRDLVVQALLSKEQRLVEVAISNGGGVGQAPDLSNGGTQLAAAANVVEAFGKLEAAYDDLYGLPAVIHVPTMAAAAVKANHLVEKDGAIWRTVMGNAVSFGAYTGADQTGAVPASPATNIYITGQVTVWHGPIWVSPWAESIDKTTNQVHRFAERNIVVAYECSSVAVQVTDAFACC